MATVLSIGTPDQLNPISLTCSDPAACTLPGLDLAPGATVTATLVEQVCCFPEGTSRSAAVSALVNSQPPEPTPDPDALQQHRDCRGEDRRPPRVRIPTRVRILIRELPGSHHRGSAPVHPRSEGDQRRLMKAEASANAGNLG